MSDSLVIFVRDGLGDQDITVAERFIPLEIRERCKDKFEYCYFSLPADYKGQLENQGIIRNSHDIAFWKQLLNNSDHDHYVLVQADAWFLDPEILTEMLDLQKKYLAEFTFSENLPSGISAEIISRTLIEALPEPAENAKLMSVSQAVKANINQFDVEIFYKDPDIRSKRIDFLAADPRERKIMQSIYSKRDHIPPRNANSAIPSYQDIAQIIELFPEVLYHAPSYYEIEFCAKTNMTPIYSVRPYVKRSREQIDEALFTKIIKDADSFSLPYSISLCGGEPLLHSSIQTLIGLALESEHMTNLIIETDALHADDSFCAFLRHCNNDRIKIIVECCGYDAQSYAAIHQKDCFSTVEKNISALSELLNTEDNKRLYLQIMKINETEVFLDQYYDFWESRKIPIILQKQNTWLGLTENRKYYDLSPIKRIPCWHLQRDLFITCDGLVPFCKQDINCIQNHSCKDLSIPAIWNERKDSFIRNYKGTLTAIIDCASCDEWYTFNL